MPARSSRPGGPKRHKSKRVSAHGSLRYAAFGAVVLGVVAFAVYLLLPAFRQIGAGAPGSVTVQLSMAGFSPAQIVARAGEPLTLRLVNMDNSHHTDGGGWHQFAIEALDVDVKIPPLKTQELVFTPSQSGRFEFYCDVCCGGRQNPAMQGTLAVES